jgi:hypothetical protein
MARTMKIGFSDMGDYSPVEAEVNNMDSRGEILSFEDDNGNSVKICLSTSEMWQLTDRLQELYGRG